MIEKFFDFKCGDGLLFCEDAGEIEGNTAIDVIIGNGAVDEIVGGAPVVSVSIRTDEIKPSFVRSVKSEKPTCGKSFFFI